MSSSLLIEISLIIILIIANGFFAASEIAIVSARKGRLEQQAAAGHQGAVAALQLAENPNRFLSTVQIGITLISTLAAAFGGDRLATPLADYLVVAIPTLANYAPGIALGVVVIILSYLSLIIGELVPKRLALQSAEAVAARVAPIMNFISRAAGPFVTFLSFSSDVVLRLLGRHAVEAAAVTEEDILALVREGTEEGTVEAAEQALISSVFTFSERSVRALMTPRTQIVAVALDTPLTDILTAVTDSGYSRIPVYEDTLDQVVGMLYAKDLLLAWGRPEAIDLRAMLRPPVYVPESQRAVLAFQYLKQTHKTVALVLDEYGQVAGLISIEDMLEALVGDLNDEYDVLAERVVRRDDGSYLVDGLLPFDELQTRLGLPTTGERERDFETVAGFVLAYLGRIPETGAIMEWQGYRVEVIDMDGRRIDKVLITPP